MTQLHNYLTALYDDYMRANGIALNKSKSCDQRQIRDTVEYDSLQFSQTC